MAVWSEVYLSDLKGAMRIDPEYYQPEYINFTRKAEHGEQIGGLLQFTMHLVELKRIYEDRGLQILLAQNIRNNRLDFATAAYMPKTVLSKIAKNRLVTGDVVVTRSGANYGDAACYLGDPEEIYACADCLVLRPRDISGGYLSTYLNSKIGRALLKRGQYGGAQPHIAPTHIESLRIPRLGKIKSKIHNMVVEAQRIEKEAQKMFERAEYELLKELGFHEFDLSHSLYYETSFSDIIIAERFDAEHYQPKYLQVVNICAKYKGGYTTIEDLAASITNGVESRSFVQEGVPYIRVGDMKRLRIDSKSAQKIPYEAAEKFQDKISLETGDVLSARSGSIGQASVITNVDKNSVLSSHLIRIRLHKNSPVKSSYLALFLATLPGIQQVLKNGNGGIVPEISQPNLRKVVVPKPSVKFQDRLAEMINESHQREDEALDILDKAKLIIEETIIE